MNRFVLTAFCSALPALRTAAAERDDEAILSSLLDRARAGEDIWPELSELASVWGVELDLQPQRNRAAATGIPSLSGIFGRPSRPQIYRCPGQVCDRLWVRQPAVDPPECGVHAQPLGRS